jgi:hypothetical protein
MALRIETKSEDNATPDISVKQSFQAATFTNQKILSL